MRERNEYWFPAKSYGWGWGAPRVWQGWVVLIMWIIGFAAGAAFILPRNGMAYAVFVVAMLMLIMGICYWKGEPPRWRWGR